MDVKKISLEVQCLLSATARINNYKRVVEELVYNSLDAESTCIAIRIHIQNNWIQVVDNGIGIKNADYHLLGKRYATSKLLDINTLKALPSKYGYQGQALANIIEISQTVKITSRCSDTNDTWVKTFRKGKVELERFEAPMRPSKGTTVEINGLLYNLNIQKRNIKTFNELQDIKTFLEQLLLVFNHVSISLRDDSQNEIIFKMHRNRGIYQTLKSLFDIDINQVQELQVEKNEYKVKAFIGIDKRSVKNWHWIYMNNKLVSISNLHKIIDNKFTKPNCMKHKKIKTTGKYGYDVENSVACQSVPFYFLFIACPYYDYDIIRSGKQTAIEFKDWTQMNKLIEKLVKFYNGDIHLVNVQKNDIQKHISKKVVDTRGEVKKIMEKILERPNKTAKISQMQNGIKGKLIKRRKKKQPGNISLTKILLPKRNTPYKSLDKNVENKVIKTAKPKHCDSGVSPEKQRKTEARNKVIKKSKNKYTEKRKCKKKYVTLAEMFKADTDLIKEKCNELSRKIKKKLNLLNYEITNDILKNPMKNYSPILERKEFKCIAKESKISINTERTDNVEFKPFAYNQKPVIEKMRSYDLIQTVLKTQEDLHELEPRKEDSLMPLKRSNIQGRSSTKSCYRGLEGTFESHKYNNINGILNEKRVSKKVHFISKQSREKFNTDSDKYDGNIQIKTRKSTKDRGLFNSKYKKKLYTNTFNSLVNKYKNNEVQTPFTINISGTDTVEFSKQIRNQIMSDMNSLFNNEDNDKICPSPKTQINFGVNLNMEKTYTIIMDSFYNISQALNDDKNRRTFVDERVTYNNVSRHKTIQNNHTNKILNVLHITETQDTSELRIDNPLDICEAILNSTNYTENNLKDCLNITHDLSLAINESRNIYQRENSASALPLKKDDEKIGTLNANTEARDQITHKNDKCVSIETNVIQDDSVYNFKLNPRHRFLPNGMSQIFKNCYSKNICSYNLDKEYYENTIYNNFVDDVAINSEIYEPKLQNVKEFTTGDIQKVTERLKKHNANLIFGTESLRSAKVLGQVDCKFIAAIIKDLSQTHQSPELLVLFDQHAVHERISLENNLSDYFNGTNWKKITIDTISLKSTKDEILYLHNHKDKFARFGLQWTVLNNSEIVVNAIPKAIRGKNPRPVEIIVKTVKDLILEQMHAIKHLKGNVSLYPQSIMNLVFSEACRYAIKFGDILSTRDCVELIAALANCKTPFQCAHGRPAMAVMVELRNEQIGYKVDMEKIMQFKNRIKK